MPGGAKAATARQKAPTLHLSVESHSASPTDKDVRRTLVAAVPRQESQLSEMQGTAAGTAKTCTGLQIDCGKTVGTGRLARHEATTSWHPVGHEGSNASLLLDRLGRAVLFRTEVTPTKAGRAPTDTIGRLKHDLETSYFLTARYSS